MPTTSLLSLTDFVSVRLSTINKGFPIMMTSLRTGLALVLLTGMVMAQAPRPTCTCMDRDAHLHATDPEYPFNRATIESHTQNMILAGATLTETVYTIPVVVHVIWNTPAQNIPDAQIHAQIAALNLDFRMRNTDASQTLPQFAGVAADCEIQFCLASRDPQGNPTNGITRTQTAVVGFAQNGDPMMFDSTGGKDIWNRDHYMNIYVCPFIPGTTLGYASFPGGPPNTDAIAIDTPKFGIGGHTTAPNQLGRTLTHEVGHWLNLSHIWGDGPCGMDDLVTDTPESDMENFGCMLTHVSCGTLDMVQNYMDYSDDSCMSLFTQGQAARMRAVLISGGPRNSILSSPACPQGAGEYQVNQGPASLAFNGTQGSTSIPAVTTLGLGMPGTTTATSSNTGMPYEIAVSVVALVPRSAAGLPLPGGDIINLDVTQPLIFVNSGFTATSNLIAFPASGVNIPFNSTIPTSFAAQMLIADPTLLGGSAVSQAARLIVQ